MEQRLAKFAVDSSSPPRMATAFRPPSSPRRLPPSLAKQVRRSETRSAIRIFLRGDRRSPLAAHGSEQHRTIQPNRSVRIRKRCLSNEARPIRLQDVKDRYLAGPPRVPDLLVCCSRATG